VVAAQNQFTSLLTILLGQRTLLLGESWALVATISRVHTVGCALQKRELVTTHSMSGLEKQLCALSLNLQGNEHCQVIYSYLL
jgi:hypothetical protein